MLGIALMGLVSNLIAVQLLYLVWHSNLTVKAAFSDVSGDTISSIGVIVSSRPRVGNDAAGRYNPALRRRAAWFPYRSKDFQGAGFRRGIIPPYP